MYLDFVGKYDYNNITYDRFQIVATFVNTFRNGIQSVGKF